MLYSCNRCHKEEYFSTDIAAENFGVEVIGASCIGSHPKKLMVCEACLKKERIKNLLKKTSKIYYLDRKYEPKPKSKNELMFEEFY